MKRTLSRRVSALLVAVLLLVSRGVDAYALHPCPHHDAIAAGAGAHQGVAGTHGEVGHHAHAAASDDATPDGAHAAPSEDVDAAPPHGGSCTCAGVCEPPPAAVPAPAADGGPRAAVVRGGASLPAQAAEPFGRRLPFLLPYPTAPPPAAA